MSLRLDYQRCSPLGMKALGGVYSYVSGCGLEKSLVDLVYLRASQINGCAYCVATHSRDLLTAGRPPEALMLLACWREAGSTFTSRERAALAWTEAVTLVAATHVPDDVFAAAHLEFDPKQLSDLTLAIALINAYNRLAISFRRSAPAVPSQ